MVRVPRLLCRGSAAPRAQAFTGLRVVLLASVALAVGGCAKNVPQDSKSGEDGSYKNAREIKLENNEAKSRGIVTYPGGDRVDWKVIELPKDKQGTLKLTLRWVPPRPGLDLSFDVYNEWNHVVQSAKPNKKKRSRKTSKAVTVDNAQGKYFIQVYASERGDAGKYTLSAEFAEIARGDTFDWLKVEIADPPKLPAVPDAVKDCDAASFDKKNPSCKAICPMPPDPAWPACAGACPVPPDPAIPKCLETMPCPADKPDRKFKMCKVEDFAACTAAIAPDDRKKNPRCDNWEPPPIIADLTDIQDADGGGVLVTIGAGSVDGVGKGWKGVLLDDSDVPIKGTDFVVQRVTKNAAVGKIGKLTRDQVRPDARVRLKAK